MLRTGMLMRGKRARTALTYVIADGWIAGLSAHPMDKLAEQTFGVHSLRKLVCRG
jgi:hypothetical protein